MRIYWFKFRILVQKTKFNQDTIPPFNNTNSTEEETTPITNKTNMEAILIQLYKVNYKNLFRNLLNSWSLKEEQKEKLLKKW